MRLLNDSGISFGYDVEPAQLLEGIFVAASGRSSLLQNNLRPIGRVFGAS